MKNIARFLVAGAVTVIFSVSCQDVFTTSAFSFVETDMSTMNDAQKVTYAEDLLSSGTTEQLAEAYTEISALLPEDYATSTDLTDEQVEMVILAADLAVGSSGVGDAITSAIEVFSSGEEMTQDSITEIYSSIDTTNLSAAVDLIEAAEANGAELTSAQYTNAAAAQVLVVLDQVETLGLTDPSELNESNPEQAAILDDLEQALAWAEAGGVDLSLFGSGLSLP